MTATPLQIRPARAADRDAVLAFCQQTWRWGDYIADVWDRWLADRQGLLAVGEVAGQVMGVDKLTLLTPMEAFFEGLRIDPAYRGQGYAQQFQRHMLTEAAQRGATVVRFLTAIGNTAVHKMAERDGFQRGPAVLPWEAPALSEPPPGVAMLRALPPGPQAIAAWAALPVGPLWAATGGLLSETWHYQAWTAALWATLLVEHKLLTTPELAPDTLVALLPDVHDAETVWIAWLDSNSATPDALARLALAARHAAAEQGAATVRAMLPHQPAYNTALTTAGFTSDPDNALLLFAKPLGPG